MSRLAVALNALDRIVLGKPVQVRLSLACLLAGGHLLLEDIPGVGKTTLAQALAQVLGLQWQRVQFTSDLLPADLLGVAVYDRHSQQFDLRRGPVFTQLLLADEINRASPRCSKPWPNDRSASTASPTRCQCRSSWWPRKIRTNS